jgi:hypothetical protein
LAAGELIQSAERQLGCKALSAAGGSLAERPERHGTFASPARLASAVSLLRPAKEIAMAATVIMERHPS